LPSSLENRERFREGGVPARALPDRLSASRAAGEVDHFRDAFLRFRAFDRPNVLHLFATFRRNARFAREFPAAVQTGPLWPHRYRPRRTPSGSGHVVWYASPSSAERIAPEVVRGLAEGPPTSRLLVRTPRPWAPGNGNPRMEVVSTPLSADRWSTIFRRADLRIVTGSRSLLEAMEVGGPFLYFNGILGEGGHPRRHRPEKIAALLDAYRDRLPPDVRRDLADFARGRRVAAAVRRATAATGGWRKFPSTWWDPAFRPPFDDAGSLTLAVAHALAAAPGEALRIVERVRRGSNP